MQLDPELDLQLVREMNAPRELLYKCWTTPEHLVHWFVPKPHKVTYCHLAVRPGGACNTTFEVDGNLMENNAVYLEVIPNEKPFQSAEAPEEARVADAGPQIVTVAPQVYELRLSGALSMAQAGGPAAPAEGREIAEITPMPAPEPGLTGWYSAGKWPRSPVR